MVHAGMPFAVWVWSAAKDLGIMWQVGGFAVLAAILRRCQRSSTGNFKTP